MARHFSRDLIYPFFPTGLIIPMLNDETYVAFDQNQTLWAFTAQPIWSPASQKWIPQDHDTPRHIITWKGAQVNAKDSIAYCPVY
ncbi:hypothetical protein D3C73_1185770 [compost metagenome]